MHQGKRLLEALKTLQHRPMSGTVFRAVRLKFVQTPISAIGSLIAGARFTPKHGRFETLYGAFDEDTMTAETRPSLPGLQRIPPRLQISIDFALSKVIEIHSPEAFKTLNTNPQEMFGPWSRPGQEQAPTQDLGLAMWRSGIEGFVYESAKNPGGLNLGIFPNKLQANSSVSVYDPLGVIQRIELRGTKKRKQ